MVFAALYNPARQRVMKNSALKAAAEESVPVPTPRAVGWLLHVVSVSRGPWKRQRVTERVTQ